ncbi:hypothetical protein IT157_04585 [bacterium]|nr:hypothetical protein [bacterium]
MTYVLYINELSFNQSARSEYEIGNIAGRFAKTELEARPILRGLPPLVHRDIWFAELCNNVTVSSWVNDRTGSAKDAKQLLLQLLKKAKYIDTGEFENEIECDFDKMQVTKTGLGAATFASVRSNMTSVLLSCSGSSKFNCNSISVDFLLSESGSIIETRELRNLTSPSEVNSLRRMYEPNPKHREEPKSDGYIAAMNLVKRDAQQVLDAAHHQKDCSYGYRNGTYYLFRPTRIEINLYHGFCIAEENVPTNICKDLRNRCP